MFPLNWLRVRRPHTIRHRPKQVRRSVRLELECLEARLVPAVFDLTAPDTASLEADIQTANGDPTNQYVIQLTGSTYNLTAAQVITNTAGVTLEGSGSASSAVINAAANSRAFQVGSGANVIFAELTIQGGVATDDGLDDGSLTARGGGILDLGGNVTLSSVAVQHNAARGGTGTASAGGDADGGGIYVSDGTLILRNSTVSDNTVVGGLGAVGANSTFGTGSGGFSGGTAFGGGVAGSGATIDILNSSITGNIATGGLGGNGGNAGPTEGPGYGGGAGGYGGFAEGGGLANLGGTVQMINSTVATNTVVGGNGGTGGTGGLGSVGGPGGPGGAGGEGLGGGIYEAGFSSVYLNITVTQNSARGGLSGTTGPGGGSAVTTTSPIGIGAQVAAFAAGGGLYVSSESSPTLTNTLLENNTAPNGPDYFGPVNPNDSNNFVSNDSGAITFNPATNILNNSTPQLGPATIGPNGTTYYPLLAGSQSINAGTNSVLPTIATAEGVPQSQATDQIGNPRLVGPFLDIGSIEFPGQPTTTTVGNPSAPYTNEDPTITLSATVTSNGVPVNEGQVQFVIVGLTPQPITAQVVNGQATALFGVPPNTPLGNYTITATYSTPTGDFQTSSGAGTLTIFPSPTTVTINNVSIVYGLFGAQETLTAVVRNALGVVVNEGFVTFSDGGQTATAPIVNGLATVTLNIPLMNENPFGSTIALAFGDSSGNFLASIDLFHLQQSLMEFLIQMLILNAIMEANSSTT